METDISASAPFPEGMGCPSDTQKIFKRKKDVSTSHTSPFPVQ